MSSKRNLKKDINFLTYEILNECFTLRSFHPEIEEGDFENVIRELVSKRNELIDRLNHAKVKEGETLAQYYRNIRYELHEFVALAEKLTK